MSKEKLLGHVFSSAVQCSEPQHKGETCSLLQFSTGCFVSPFFHPGTREYGIASPIYMRVLHQRVRWTPRCDMVQAVSFNVPSMGTPHSTWNRALFSYHSVIASTVEISLIRRMQDYKELEVTEQLHSFCHFTSIISEAINNKMRKKEMAEDC